MYFTGRTNCISNKRNCSSREEWHNYYIDEIYDIYLIIKEVMEKYYPNQINWDKKYVFHNLSRTLYHCSSKYIYKDRDYY